MSKVWEEVLEAASGDMRRLSYVDRFASIPVTIKENVAEHSYWVAVYSLMIHRAASPTDFHIAPILSYALVHDLVECVSGDLVRTFKYSTPKLKEAVDEAEGLLSDGFDPRLKDLMELPWTLVQSNGDLKYVKAVVKAADFVSLHQYMVREVNRGNREIGPFFQRMQRDLLAEGEKFGQSPDKRISGMKDLFDAMAARDTPGRYTT
jgi:5'-deoxynucleotidase YfbR-like HD superfamily hydrolase